MTKRWLGPEHQYAEARWFSEQHEEYLHEIWKENNPKCDECGDREHVDTMTNVRGNNWCSNCEGDE